MINHQISSTNEITELNRQRVNYPLYIDPTATRKLAKISPNSFRELPHPGDARERKFRRAIHRVAIKSGDGGNSPVPGP